LLLWRSNLIAFMCRFSSAIISWSVLVILLPK
jgi:hypothetical protein